MAKYEKTIQNGKKTVAKTHNSGITKVKIKNSGEKHVYKKEASGDIIKERLTDDQSREEKKIARVNARQGAKAERVATRVNNKAARLRLKASKASDKASAASDKFEAFKKEHGLAKGGSLKCKSSKCKK